MCIYHVSIIKEEVKNCGVNISSVNNHGGRYKVAACIYHVSIIKEEFIKFWCVYIVRQSSRNKLKNGGVYL